MIKNDHINLAKLQKKTNTKNPFVEHEFHHQPPNITPNINKIIIDNNAHENPIKKLNTEIMNINIKIKEIQHNKTTNPETQATTKLRTPQLINIKLHLLDNTTKIPNLTLNIVTGKQIGRAHV